MKTTTLAMLIGIALGGAVSGATAAPPPTADTAPDTAPDAATSAPAQHRLSYLGVALTPIPDAVGANLLANVPAGQGVMVMQVEPGSPAARAGLAPYDILLRYGDQKLYSPRQLTHLVQADPAGTQVEIEYVHQGKVETTQATLDARAMPPAAPERSDAAPVPPMSPWFHPNPITMPDFGLRAPTFGPDPHGAFASPPGQAPNPAPVPVPRGNAMEQFDSLSIQQSNGRYQIAMSYLDDQGVTHRFRYEGAADEVKKVIEADQTLPDDKRAQLLDALDMNGPPPGMPDIRSLMQQMGVPGLGPWGPPRAWGW